MTDYWLDATAGRVAALVPRPVDVDQAQRVSCARVGHIGHDTVMLKRASGQANSSLEAIHENWPDRNHVKPLTVYSDDGDRLDRVAEAHIDPVTLNIQS